MGLYIYLFHNKMPTELSYDKSYATAEPLESGLHTLSNQSPYTTSTDAKSEHLLTLQLGDINVA